MKIGIITFHWATNYGAVLQAYALQEYLLEIGHDVEIINYKPWHYDFFKKYIIAPWMLLNLRKDLIGRKKEKKLKHFRNFNLKTTKRFYSSKALSNSNLDYDIVISGSDQVLNPTFTINGERKPSSAYYLTFAKHSKRIGYAVSFGCTSYPEKSLFYARQWINFFDIIGVRELTGLDVLSQMSFVKNQNVVPDPTILYGSRIFNRLQISISRQSSYYCVYVLRKSIMVNANNVVYIDEYNNPLSMEEWLGTIIYSKGLITNSYHGMIMAILNHVPFVVLLETKRSGMNDRFVTLLSRLELTCRITDESSDYFDILQQEINWHNVDSKLLEYRLIGETFFNEIL